MLFYSIMASVEKWKVIWCVCFVFLRTLKTESIEIEGHGPAPEFFRHVVVKPRIFHGREKRSIQSTRKHQDGVEHLHDVTLAYNLNGKEHLIDLRLNRELIPKNYFERHHKNGSTVINRPDSKNVELCHYIGKVRGAKNSWAALSTCSGLSGMVYTGESIHYIEKAKGNSSEEDDDDDKIHGKDHFVYDHKDLKVNHTCGYSGTAFHHINSDINLENTKLRYKRSTDVIHGPYNANKTSRYVELVLVVDQRDFKGHGENLKTVYTHCKKIANLINALYMPLNIFIALVGVVVWTEHDEFHIDTNGDTTLTNFLQYRRTKLVKEHPNDNAQLLTRVQFEGGVVGKALKGPICTYEFSGGVNMDHSPVVGLVATTVAHEMGHNFGMEHDGSSCECPEEKCIMASSSSSSSPTHWSSCSYEYLLLAFGHGMDYCLRNKPTSLFDSPVCGNGFVEPGEQCDCGLAGHCTNPCCNMTSCMLYSNASCATGECCDFTTCRPKTAGSVCRSADHECDLPEYCTGHSEYCPADVYKMDGETCNKGKAYCYQGSCRSHSDQCKLLWGPSGMSSDTQCYKMNLKGNRYGNCGYNRVNQSYLKCEGDNVQCGMLHCKHLNEKLEFGMESVAILSHSFINTVENEVIPCRTAIVDLGLNEVDPGLAPDGAKCGVGMMCVNQKCMNVSSLRAASPAGDCPKGCSGNGVCNSLGHCHCKLGFAPPYCDYPGTGGSLDSGPATDPHAHWEVITALYAIFFGIVPFVTIVGLITYHLRHNPSPFWRKKPRSIIMYVSKCSSFDCMKRSKGSGRSVRKVTAAPPGMPPTSHRPPDISFVGCPVEIPNSPISSHLHNSTQQSSNYQGRAATNVLNASSFGHKHLQLAPNPFNSPFPDPKSQDESNTEHIYAEIKDVRKPVSEYCSTDLINTEPIYSNIPPTTSKPGYVPMLSPKVGVGSTAQNNDILSTKHEWGSIFRDSSLYKKLEKNIAGLKTEKHDTSAQSLAPSAPPAHLQPSQRPHIEIIKSDLIFSTNPMVKTLMK